MSFVLINLVCYIFLILMPLYKAAKGLFSFFKGYSMMPRTNSPTDILDCLERGKDAPSYSKGKSYPEILYNGICPVLGSIFIYVFQKEITPFSIDHSLTLLAFSAIPFIAYWTMKFGGQALSIKNLGIVECSLVFGSILYLGYGLHFCSEMTLMGIAMLPIFGFALLAPFPAMFYLLRELVVVKSLINEKTDRFLVPASILKSTFRMSERTKGYVTFVVGCAVLLSTLVLVGGQDWDSLIRAFRGGSAFFFSY